MSFIAAVAGKRYFTMAKIVVAFMKLMAEPKERYPVKGYGYCLMANHFHMAVRPSRVTKGIGA